MLEKLLAHPVAAVALFFGSVGLLVLLPLATVGFKDAATYFGALVGFAALLIGALTNAELNRKRDDRLHNRDVRAAFGAVLFEVQQVGFVAERLVNAFDNPIPPSPLITNDDVLEQLLAAITDSAFRKHNDQIFAAAVEHQDVRVDRIVKFYYQIDGFRTVARKWYLEQDVEVREALAQVYRGAAKSALTMSKNASEDIDAALKVLS